MDDDELIALIREQRTRVPLTTPVALTVSALPRPATCTNPVSPGGSGAQATRTQTPAQLTGFTVTDLANGNISVTVSQLRNPAALQAVLRSDGVPATVTFAAAMNAACLAYPASGSLQQQVFPAPSRVIPPKPSGAPTMVPAGIAPSPPPVSPGATVVVIDPSALPGGAGVQLATASSGNAFLVPQLVAASAQCTGS